METMLKDDRLDARVRGPRENLIVGDAVLQTDVKVFFGTSFAGNTPYI